MVRTMLKLVYTIKTLDQNNVKCQTVPVDGAIDMRLRTLHLPSLKVTSTLARAKVRAKSAFFKLYTIATDFFF